MPSRRSIFTCLYLFAYSSNLLIVVLRADRFVLARTCSYRKTLASEFGDSNGFSGRRRFELPMPVTNAADWLCRSRPAPKQLGLALEVSLIWSLARRPRKGCAGGSLPPTLKRPRTAVQ